MTEQIEAKSNMIVTIVSKGYADIVVAAAKEAGARFCTMLYARGSGVHETEKFLNTTIEPEKEIVLTFVRSTAVKDVVSSITGKVGLATAGGGITFVLPITRTAGIAANAAEKAAAEAGPAAEGQGE